MPDRSDFLAVVGSLVTGAVVSGVKPAEGAVAGPATALCHTESGGAHPESKDHGFDVILDVAQGVWRMQP